MGDIPTFSLGELVQGTIGVFATLLIVFIIYSFSQPTLAADKSKLGTRVSTGELAFFFDDFDRPVVRAGYETIPNIYIESGFYVLTFDADSPWIHDACLGGLQERPDECALGKACFCLCVKGKPCKDNLPTCRSFENIKRIWTPMSDQNFVGELKGAGMDGRYLLLYGKCSTFGSEMGVKNLYIYAASTKERSIILDDKVPQLSVQANQTANATA